jgi:molybdopterin synthase catalytic subunit
MAPGTFVRGKRGRWVRAVSWRVVIIGPLTPLHEPERLSTLRSLWASPRPLRCRLLSGELPWVVVQPPASGNSWLSLTSDPMPIAAAYEWAVLPECGAVVLFSGTVRNHAVDEQGVLRDHVESLTYEAYDSQVVPRFEDIEAELRQRWPETGRVVLIHRTGTLVLGESSVIAVVSAPHRAEAFEAARFAIDALKASAPIWKREVWLDGADWGVANGVPIDAASVPTSSGRRAS